MSLKTIKIVKKTDKGVNDVAVVSGELEFEFERFSSVFVRVEEYTETEDLEESYQIWDNLLAQLKEIIGA